jgi:uncharacterized protein
MNKTPGKSSKTGKTGETVVTLAVKPRRPCPICGRPAVKAYRPFCSARCADVDLGNWVSGRYRVPSDEELDDEVGNGDASAPAAADGDED